MNFIDFGLGFLSSILLALFAWWVLGIIGRWLIFNKMGEPGWKSIIPFLSDYTIFKRVWVTAYFWMMLALGIASSVLPDFFSGYTGDYLTQLCGCALFVILFLENIKLSRSFGHGYLFAFGLIVLNPVFTLILGFGSSMYIGNTTPGVDDYY